MNCEICGRKLKNSNSIELGYGPVCYKKVKVSGEHIKRSKNLTSGLDNINYDIPGQIELEDYLQEFNA